MDGVAAARQGKARQWALEKEHQRQVAKTPNSDEKKQNNACPTVPCACPLPLAPCPSPEATHNKAELNNKDVTTNQGVGQGEGCCGVGSLGRKAWHKEHQKERGEEKKTTKKKKKKKPLSCPCPWALLHISPRSYPRPSFL